MTLCTETRHAVRNAMLLEITANLLRVAERLEHADPAVDQDLRLLLEVAEHAGTIVQLNSVLPAVKLPLAAGSAPAVEQPLVTVVPAGATSKKGPRP